MSVRYLKCSQESVNAVRVFGTISLWLEGLVEKVCFDSGVKKRRICGQYRSDEIYQKLILEIGWCKTKWASVIFKAVDVDGRVVATANEEQVLRLRMNRDKLIQTDKMVEWLWERSSTQSFLITVPPHNIDIAARRFSDAVPRLWNSLPLSCQTAPSANIFKNRLKTFLFKRLTLR